MKRGAVLTEGELNALDWELRDAVARVRPLTIYDPWVKSDAPTGRVFPWDGYMSWQHRWFMGTGVRPKGW